jgi:hypothetical protein
MHGCVVQMNKYNEILNVMMQVSLGAKQLIYHLLQRDPSSK